MTGQDAGGIGICDPPNGTVKYPNAEGLNCTRTGLVAHVHELLTNGFD